MKKQKITFLVLAVLCVLCAGSYFALKQVTFSEEEGSTETAVLTDFKTEDVTAVSVSGNNLLSFAKEEDVWKNTDSPEEEIQDSSVESMLLNLNALETESWFEAPEDLSDYGLEEPGLTVRISLTDGTQVVLYIGNEMELLGQYYARVEGDPNVYLIPASAVTALEREASSFVAPEETESETAGETAAEAETTEVETTETGTETETEAIETATETEIETEAAEAEATETETTEAAETEAAETETTEAAADSAA